MIEDVLSEEESQNIVSNGSTDVIGEELLESETPRSTTEGGRQDQIKERLKLISKEEALRMKKIMEIEKKRNEAMQLEIQGIERQRREEEEECQRQRIQMLELRKLKRLQDSKERRLKLEKVIRIYVEVNQYQ